MRMPPPPPNQPFAPGKWTKTIWLLVKFKKPLGLFQVTSIINLYMQCIPFFLAYFGIAPFFFGNNPFSARTWCQGTKAMLSFNDRLLGISLGAFSAWSSSRSSEDSIVAASEKVGPTGGKLWVCSFKMLWYLNEGGWRWCIEFCLIWYEIIEIHTCILFRKYIRGHASVGWKMFLQFGLLPTFLKSIQSFSGNWWYSGD